MNKMQPEDRLMVLEFIDTLFKLDQIGWNMDDLLRECGRMLGDDDQPKYMRRDMTIRQYQAALLKAKRKGVPVEVFKQRMRRGMDPDKAASQQYYPRKRGCKSSE